MNDLKYWEDRSIATLIQAEMSAVDSFSSLEQAYDKATLSIRKEINDFFEKYAKAYEKDTGRRVSYTEARKLLMGPERTDFNTQLKEWYRAAHELGLTQQYSEHLQKLGQRVHISRLEALEESIRYQVEELGAKQVDGLTDLKEVNYIAAYYKSYYDLSTGTTAGIKFSQLDAQNLERALTIKREAADFSSLIWHDKAKLLDALNTLLPQSFVAGLSSKQIGDMLATQMNVSRGVAKNLVRTEVNLICNQGMLEMYKAAGMEKYIYLATLDMRTTEICRGLHLEPFLVNKAKVGLNYPPMHVNCRSTTIADVLDIDDEEFEIAARDTEGKTIHVPGNMSQETWIRTYAPKDQQVRLLSFLDKYKYVKE